MPMESTSNMPAAHPRLAIFTSYIQNMTLVSETVHILLHSHTVLQGILQGL